MRLLIKMRLLFFCFMASVFNTGNASSIPIDLNNFFADSSISIAADGSSALLQEDPLLFSVLLINDPGLGDPNVIIPGAGTTLNFSFSFNEIIGEDDEFGAFLFDATTGLTLGSAFEFFTQESSAGTIAFDLSSLVGDTLGLQFQLASLFGDTGTGSNVTVSNVFLNIQSDGITVDEPGTMFLFLLSGILMSIKFINRKVS
jgi:hypothetical protein